jgi:hypothetical protein
MLIGLVAVLAAQVGLGVAVETVKPEWRDPEYGHRLNQLRHLKESHPDRPLVLAIGSSRTQMGLSPADMGFADAPGSPLVYNFGQAGAGSLRILLTLLRVLDAGVKPDYVLIEWFPIALAADGPAEEQAKGWAPWLGLADVRRLAPHCDRPLVLGGRWATSRIDPWYVYRLTLMSHWQPGWLRWQDRLTYQWDQLDRFGWLPYPAETVSDEVRATGIEAVRKQIAATLLHFRVGAASDHVLRDLLTRCRNECIPVAFYTTPEGPTVRSFYQPAGRAELSAYAATLSREYGVPLFDASDGFAEVEFADGHHLLRSGAARFSRRLADEYLRGWVKEQ